MVENNRLSLLRSLKETFASAVGTVFLTDRPSSTATQKDAFMVIRMGDMDNLGAYGESSVTLMLFQKDVNGLESTSLLDTMKDAVLSLMPINNELFYSERPQVLGSRSDGSGYHYLCIYFDITIK